MSGWLSDVCGEDTWLLHSSRWAPWAESITGHGGWETSDGGARAWKVLGSKVSQGGVLGRLVGWLCPYSDRNHSLLGTPQQLHRLVHHQKRDTHMYQVYYSRFKCRLLHYTITEGQENVFGSCHHNLITYVMSSLAINNQQVAK